MQLFSRIVIGVRTTPRRSSDDQMVNEAMQAVSATPRPQPTLSPTYTFVNARKNLEHGAHRDGARRKELHRVLTSERPRVPLALVHRSDLLRRNVEGLVAHELVGRRGKAFWKSDIGAHGNPSGPGRRAGEIRRSRDQEE